ncbi:MAG TPA: zf-HC2 domain-containing protein, partial [Candidatus Solibacter sp.]|nr:zf-HC2 domain-containing protein [Candidatus Solibacter sp.]
MEPTTHPFDREDVMAYLDGELTAERAAATAVHLEQCAECRALAASLRSLTSQLPQWEVEMIPATVEQNVIRAAR